jgi:single-stranded-DNA-specific exonuclease
MKWEVIDKSKSKRLSDYDKVLRTILLNRGISSKKDAEGFLNPSIDNLYDPLELFDSKKAASRVEKAIKNKEKIFIHGDYDADGITATSLLWNYLYRKRGADVTPYIPSRVDEGYGLSEESVHKIKQQGADLIITVDCGIRDVGIVDKEKDVDFIITDHHQPGKKITKNAPVVHPMHPEKKYPYENISGCAVTWKFICAMEKLRLGKKFDASNVPGIDLVGLSTVTDIMPIIDENRIFVKYSLDKIHDDPNLGVSKLIEASQLDQESIDTYHFGFVLGPKLNASGRIGDPMEAVRLLLTESDKAAEKIAKRLTKLNTERQELTDQVMNEAKGVLGDGEENYMYFAYKDGWSEGIIGLAAGKIQEEFYRPVIVATDSGEMVKGSARSVKGFNITEAIENFSDILEKYGGHEQAAGFTIKKENLDKFQKGIVKYATDKLKDQDLEREIKIDMKIDAKDINYDLVETVEKLKPFGIGNRRPVFEVDDVVVVSSRAIGNGNKHLKFSIKSENSDFINCILFNAGDWVENLKPGTIIDLVGTPELNVWNSQESVQLSVSDVRISK